VYVEQWKPPVMYVEQGEAKINDRFLRDYGCVTAPSKITAIPTTIPLRRRGG
jgi:hypothetical protein